MGGGVWTLGVWLKKRGVCHSDWSPLLQNGFKIPLTPPPAGPPFLSWLTIGWASRGRDSPEPGPVKRVGAVRGAHRSRRVLRQLVWQSAGTSSGTQSWLV